MNWESREICYRQFRDVYLFSCYIHHWDFVIIFLYKYTRVPYKTITQNAVMKKKYCTIGGWEDAHFECEWHCLLDLDLLLSLFTLEKKIMESVSKHNITDSAKMSYIGSSSHFSRIDAKWFHDDDDRLRFKINIYLWNILPSYWSILSHWW